MSVRIAGFTAGGRCRAACVKRGLTLKFGVECFNEAKECAVHAILLR